MLSSETTKTSSWNQSMQDFQALRVSIVQGYAPTNDAELQEKEKFYVSLQINIQGRSCHHYGRSFDSIFIGGSIFPHKRIIKQRGHTTENQIDYICFGKRFRNSLQDVRVYRRADVASDRYLVVAKLSQQFQSSTNEQHQTPSGPTYPH